MKNKILFRTVVGSRVFGMERPDSDTDYFEVFVQPSVPILLGIGKYKSKHFKEDGNDVSHHEIGKVISQLLYGNINNIQGATSPILVSKEVSIYKELRQCVMDNLAQNCYGSINGLAHRDYHKYILAENPDAKTAQKKCNIIGRSVDFGIHILETGKIDYTKHKDFYEREEIGQLIIDLRTAKENSSLPEKPEEQKFYEILLKIRLNSLFEEMAD